MNLNLPSTTIVATPVFFSWVVLGFAVSFAAVALSRYAYRSTRGALGFISAAVLIAYFVATILGFSTIMQQRENTALTAASSLQQQVSTRYHLEISDNQALHLVYGNTVSIPPQGKLKLTHTGGIYELVNAANGSELTVR